LGGGGLRSVKQRKFKFPTARELELILDRTTEAVEPSAQPVFDGQRIDMPEGRQTAARTYKEQYQKYCRMTEAPLNTETIPLGHRQTIRRYFRTGSAPG
jgi:hypothetical protein